MTALMGARSLGIQAARTALILALAALGLHFGAAPASACSCIELTPAEAFERADAVFVGEVTAFKIKSGLFGKSSIDPTTVVFTVNEVWKGPRQESITIRTVRSEVSCGFEFETGREYLIYARDGQTGLCDRTALAVRSQEDLAALGEGWKPPLAPADSTASSAGQPSAADPPTRGSACRPAAPNADGKPDLTAIGLFIGLVALSAWRKRGL